MLRHISEDPDMTPRRLKAIGESPMECEECRMHRIWGAFYEDQDGTITFRCHEHLLEGD